jgi:hypothetical protein
MMRAPSAPEPRFSPGKQGFEEVGYVEIAPGITLTKVRTAAGVTYAMTRIHQLSNRLTVRPVRLCVCRESSAAQQQPPSWVMRV